MPRLGDAFSLYGFSGTRNRAEVFVWHEFGSLNMLLLVRTRRHVGGLVECSSMIGTLGYGANLLERLWRPPRKIAVLRASGLGDFVCAIPALRALRFALPHAEIVMIGLPPLRDLVVRLPYVDRFAAFPGYPGIAGPPCEARNVVGFLQRMQSERFDLALQLQGAGVYANPFTLLLGAQLAAGFVTAGDDAGRLDAGLVWPEQGHEVRRVLALLRFIGAEPRGEELVFPLSAEDRRIAAQKLSSLATPLIGIHPGSRDPRRRWPVEHFATVARTLRQRHGGTVLVFGEMQERDTALQLTEAIGAGAFSVAGTTPLAMLGAAIERLGLLLVNDSGPAQVAYALGTPTVAIYRRGDKHRYGPPLAGPFEALEPNAGENAAAPSMVDVAETLAAAERLLMHAH